MVLLLILAVLLLLCLSGLTSMTEAALFSAPFSKVHVAVDKNRPGARRLLNIKEHMARPVATLLVLNNAINICGSIAVGFLAEAAFGSQWLAVFTAVLTLLVILFAEIIPKTIGERFSTAVALAAAPPLTALTKLFGPLIWLVEKLTRPFSSKGPRVIAGEEEIRVLASLGSRSGHISGHENELIRRAFRLNDVTARDIMTHRTKLYTLPADLRLEEIDVGALNVAHSRILVVDGRDMDKINGIVHLRDILLAIAQNKLDQTVGDIKQSPTFVYDATPAHRLLRQFQRTRQHLFVVLDEYGGTSGVVSLEDVLEELVGEIHDETDQVVEAVDTERKPRLEAPVSPADR